MKALLESLKGSQVWNGSEPLPIPDAGSTSGTEPASVASLLSQLQSSSSSASAAPGVEVNSASDIRSLTYQQSLPLLSRLSEDNPAFTKALTSVCTGTTYETRHVSLYSAKDQARRSGASALAGKRGDS